MDTNEIDKKSAWFLKYFFLPILILAFIGVGVLSLITFMEETKPVERIMTLDSTICGFTLALVFAILLIQCWRD